MKIMDKVSGFLASAAIALQLGTDAAKAADPEIRPASGTAEAAAEKLGLGSTREIWVGDNVSGLIPPNVRTPSAEKTLSPFTSDVSVSAVAEDRAMAGKGVLKSCQAEAMKKYKVAFADGADFEQNLRDGMSPLDAFKASKPDTEKREYRAQHIDVIHTNDAALPPLIREQEGAPVKNEHAVFQIGDTVIPATVESKTYTKTVQAPEDVALITDTFLAGKGEIHSFAVTKLNNLAMMTTYGGNEDMRPVFEDCLTDMENNSPAWPVPDTRISFTVSDITGPKDELKAMAAAVAGSACLNLTEEQLERAVPVHLSRSTLGDIPGARGLRISDKNMFADYAEGKQDPSGNGYIISASQSITATFGRTSYDEPADSCANNNTAYRVEQPPVAPPGGKTPVYHSPPRQEPPTGKPDKPWKPWFPGGGGGCDGKCPPKEPDVCVPGKGGKDFLKKLGL